MSIDEPVVFPVEEPLGHPPTCPLPPLEPPRARARARVSGQEGPDGGRMSQATADTLGSLELRPEHDALAQLARELALLLDTGAAGGRGLETYHKLAPRMAGVLRELGATPASTGRRAGGRDDDDDRDDPADAELDELEERRRTRPDRAARVDPAASAADA